MFRIGPGDLLISSQSERLRNGVMRLWGVKNVLHMFLAISDKKFQVR